MELEKWTKDKRGALLCPERERGTTEGDQRVGRRGCCPRGQGKKGLHAGRSEQLSNVTDESNNMRTGNRPRVTLTVAV